MDNPFKPLKKSHHKTEGDHKIINFVEEKIDRLSSKFLVLILIKDHEQIGS